MDQPSVRADPLPVRPGFVDYTLVVLSAAQRVSLLSALGVVAVLALAGNVATIVVNVRRLVRARFRPQTQLARSARQSRVRGRYRMARVSARTRVWVIQTHLDRGPGFPKSRSRSRSRYHTHRGTIAPVPQTDAAVLSDLPAIAGRWRSDKHNLPECLVRRPAGVRTSAHLGKLQPNRPCASANRRHRLIGGVRGSLVADAGRVHVRRGAVPDHRRGAGQQLRAGGHRRRSLRGRRQAVVAVAWLAARRAGVRAARGHRVDGSGRDCRPDGDALRDRRRVHRRDESGQPVAADRRAAGADVPER